MPFRAVCVSMFVAAVLAAPRASPEPPPARPVAAGERCGSCHALPPASGVHAKHARERVACAACHGAGYRVGRTDPALHGNGATDVSTEAGWSARGRSCANACHGTERWGGASAAAGAEGRGAGVDGAGAREAEEREHRDDRDHNRDRDRDPGHDRHHDHDRDRDGDRDRDRDRD